MLKLISVEQNMVIEVNGEDVKILSVNSKVKSERVLEELYTDEHALTKNELNYGILTLGKNNNVGRVLPKGTQITVYVENLPEITLKTHKTTIGRIDGLTKVFRDNSGYFRESQLYKLVFNVKKNQLSINTVEN